MPMQAFLKLGNTIFISGLLAALLAACSGGTGSNTPSPSATSTPTSFQTTTKTSDGLFQIQFSVTPNRLGANTFQVGVTDVNSGKPVTNVQVRLFTTMLDMDMGTDTVNMQSNGQGSYSTQGELTMSGNWQIRIQLHTPDNVLHQATVKFSTLT